MPENLKVDDRLTLHRDGSATFDGKTVDVETMDACVKAALAAKVGFRVGTELLGGAIKYARAREIGPREMACGLMAAGALIHAKLREKFDDPEYSDELMSAAATVMIQLAPEMLAEIAAVAGVTNPTTNNNTAQ